MSFFIRKKLSAFKLTMRMKLFASLLVIMAALLVSCVISMIEYARMSSYVSGLISENVNCINASQRLANAVNEYNLDILAVIGDETVSSVPNFDEERFEGYCNSLKNSLRESENSTLVDSVIVCYANYKLTSLELPTVLESDFIDSRDWFFETLQPDFERLTASLNNLDETIYQDLVKNSLRFDRGFYRSIIPQAVADGVAVMLVLMLMFFMLVYFVNPIYKMLEGLSNYRAFNKKYQCNFEGDDQLSELNNGITELTEENQQLRRRIHQLRSTLKAQK